MIITREWIRDDAEFFNCYVNGIEESYSKSDLCEFIDYWKYMLLAHGAKKGDKIAIAIDHTDIHYLAIMFAAFELGMKYTTLYKATLEKELDSPKVNAFLPLDFLIYWSSLAEHPNFSVSMNYYRNKAKVSLGYEYRHWKLNSNSFRIKIKTPILAEPDDTLLLLQTSGTTGTPKKVEHSHRTLYNLCSKNWEHLGYTEDDNVLNVSSLNHGGSISIFQLPSLYKCKNHYFASLFTPNHDVNEILYKVCKDYNITKFTSAHGGIVESLIKYIDNNGLPNLEFIILNFISPNWKDAIEKGNIKQVSSAFGSTETCGPIFIPKLNRDNVNTFDPRFLGKPTDLFDVTISDKFVVNGIVMEDILRETPEGYYFVSKNRLKKINDVDINPLDIYDILTKYTSRYNVEVFVDEIENKLYILTSDPNMVRHSFVSEVESLYEDVKIKDVLFLPNLRDFVVSVKADQQKIEAYIRGIK